MVLDNRGATRKVLTAKAQLSINNEQPIEARTIDIGADGVALLLPGPVSPGQQGRVIVNMYFGGKAHLVNAAVKVTFCVFSSGQFRAGFKFVGLEPTGLSSISAYLK